MSTSTDRQQYRDLVAQVAAKAKAILPQDVNGRVESAAKLVLNHDIEVLADGSIQVGSRSDPARVYQLVGTTCDCQDFTHAQAPQGWCQHRIAAGIDKRVRELLAALPAPPPAAHAAPLPEAPASVNCHLTIAGRQVQLTLRDSDESRLLARLEAVLQRFPLPEKTSEPGEGWCTVHHVSMRQTTKDGRTWWSHKTEQGWCKGKAAQHG
jgi:hypothetical protein